MPGTEGTRSRGWGSGFLIAPGWVLTCAHVLVHPDGRRRGTNEGEELGIVLGGANYRGWLAYNLAGPTVAAPVRWTDGDQGEPSVLSVITIRPDLALIRLMEDIPDQPCAWLTDRSGVPIGGAHLFGRQDGLSPGTELWDASCRLVGQEQEQLLLDAFARPRRGVSGGPLVDMELGEVAGVIKARSQEGNTVLAVPVSALRALTAAHHVPGAPDLGPRPYDALMKLHDRWHADRQKAGRGTASTWADVQRRLPAGDRGRTVLDRLHILDLLAALPTPHPAVVGRITAEALGTLGRAFSPGLVTWRDGQGALYEPDPGRELKTFLRFALLVATEVHRSVRDTADKETIRYVDALREWALWRSGELGPEDREKLGAAGQALPSTVLVEFEQVPYDDGGPMFDWTISLGYGRGAWVSEIVGDDPWGLSFDRAMWQVERHLRDVLAGADGPGGSPARLEVALPEKRLGAAVHDWLATGTGPVGLDRAVVVRDAGRRGRPHDLWHDRWRRVTDSTQLRSLRLAHPGSVLGSDAMRDGPAGAVPVLCLAVDSRAGSEVVAMMLENGYAVAVCAVDGHSAGQCGEECDTFLARVSELLRPLLPISTGCSTVHELPDRLRMLRRSTGAPHASSEWAGRVVLLYDDPSNPLPSPVRSRVEFPLS
ncbi:trypsin-like peptidase domain-containing protein [Streptomyces phaeochromogenes]|uniref:VMAP-C domain-containing protein n=1 Tax=Streptomyces phaeochromogenes TaxID=1923 RepID=UPI003866D65B|nr:serine protease [Streptomyces phaeochromogenes]